MVAQPARALAVVTHMVKLVIRATRELPGEGEDLMDVHCITFKHQMALPMLNIYTLVRIG